MNDELRRALLSTSNVDADADAPPDAAFLLTHMASVAVLLVTLSRAYKALLVTLASEGPSAELEADALRFAGDLGTVLQSLRTRPDLLSALEDAEGLYQPPLTVLDQLFFSFVLHTAGADPDDREAALTAAELDELMQARRVRDFLDWTQIDDLVEPE